MNKKGHPSTLQAQQPGNNNALKHGVYSARALSERAREVSDAVMAAPHTVPLDQFGADEIGSVIAALEAIDHDLAERGLTGRRGDARTMLEMKNRLSGRLERWLREFGATPASRFDLAQRVAQNESLRAALLREVAEGRRLVQRARDAGQLPEQGEQVS